MFSHIDLSNELADLKYIKQVYVTQGENVSIKPY